jgi:MFS family permease
MPTTKARLVFTLGVLLAINTMNFFDRQILAAVQEKIRKDWDLSDKDLGLLGMAFILVYAAVGLPLGRLADVWRRKWILALGVGLWSLLTFGSGLAWSFWSLFVMRLGVGIGEASCAPAANSLIGDLVPAQRRARALAAFMLGLPLGLALSSIVSGTVAQQYGWQQAFFVAGVPGLLLAVLALLIVDPVRGGADAHASAAAGSPVAFSTVIARVLSMPTMWWIIASGALHNFNMYALGTFLQSLMIRYYRVNVEQAGQISGVVLGLGALGIFAAGWLGDWAWKRCVSGRLKVAWIGAAVAVPCLLLALQAPPGEIWLFAIWLLPAYMLFYAYYGTVYATIHDIVEPKLRGSAMAIYFCAMYFLGAVLGPVAMGWASDHFARQAAEADGAEVIADAHRAIGLHDAMYLIPLVSTGLVVVLFAASQTVRGDYRRLQERMSQAAIP